MNHCREKKISSALKHCFIHLPIIFVSVKTGKPNKKELQYIAKDIHLKGNSWKQLARLLGFDDAEITACDKENEELFEKAYQMLLHWQQRKGREATYQVLYDALIDELDSFRHLAEKYCCKN